MKSNLSVLAAAAVVCGAFAACGGSASPAPGAAAGDDAGEGGVVVVPDAGAQDAASKPEAEAAPPADNGAPSQTYPAYKPAMGQLQNNGGLVMTKPVIVAITWASDPSADSFNTFADEVGGTAYWKAASSEYGVQPAVSGAANHVSMTTAAPTSLTETQQAGTSDFIDMVAQNAGTTWPAPTDQTIYAFFLPPGTSLLMPTGQGAPQDACSQGIGGYHFQATVGSVTTSYAVVPSCTFGGGNTAAQQSTMSMSHELLEAATDPHPADNAPGWVGFTNDTFAFDWFQEFADENGDACELFKDSFFEDQETVPASFDYWVQRTWSNAAGPAGHDPCQPAPSTPYFNVAPLGFSSVNITLPAQLTGSSGDTILPTNGFHILSAATATFQLGFYSDAATTGPWTLSYAEGSPIGNKTSHLTVVIDKTTGVNGEKANVTVTVNTVGPLKGELISFKSTLNGVTHYMPVIISSQ